MAPPLYDFNLFLCRYLYKSDYVDCSTTRSCCSAKYRMSFGTSIGDVGQSPSLSSAGYGGGDVAGGWEKEGGVENADVRRTSPTEKSRTSKRNTTEMELRSGDGMGARGEDNDGLLVSQLCRAGSSVVLLLYASICAGLGHPLGSRAASFGMSWR